MAASTTDFEKGFASSTVRPATSLGVLPSPDDSRGTPLELFQLLVGISTPSSLTQDGNNAIQGGRAAQTSSRERSDNVGLYQRARTEERRSRIAYICTSFISNMLYMLQILLAATFTALSAYKDSNIVTLTVLGGLNTVIAGCLAWQKGQGVPQRYRKAQDEYQSLILEIEMAERSFLDMEMCDTGGLDPRAEKARLQKLFDTARADQQANYPDLYVSTTAKESKDLAKELEDAKADAAKVQSEMLGRIDALMARLEGKVDASVSAAAEVKA